MKSISFILVAICMMLSIQISNAQIQRATLQASGLTCSMCNLSIKKNLEKIAFISKVTPNLANASYELELKH
jgi:hypothetical protein